MFTKALAALTKGTRPSGRKYVFVPYDQLSADLGPLARERPSDVGVVLVESPAKAARRPYHKQKLAMVLANLRSFALEQAARGVHVVHVVSDAGYAEALERVLPETGPLTVMDPAERELRVELSPLVAQKKLVVVPHEGWLSTREDFARACPKPPYRMDAFYKHMRAKTGLLMDARGKPEGGSLSFDKENRKPWKGSPEAPRSPTFPRDALKDEVCALVTERFASHPGAVDPDRLPATRADAEAAWAFAREHALPHFGPYEDAMSTRSSGLFHTRISALLNLHRLLPSRVVGDVASSRLPIATREGFVRQILGWREYVRHVHVATDGLRKVPGVPEPSPGEPASPSWLGADRPLPKAFWGGAPSGLHCLDTVVRDVWAEAYGHHITRLMVLSNLATLLDVSPRELTDWFWVAYADAFDWVVEPNVLGMGTYAAGPLMTTKPYVSGAAYLAKMSDYCQSCAFDPKTTCPVTRLYWAFLARHEARLPGPRMAMPLVSVRKRSAAEREADAEEFRRVSRALTEGARLSPS